VRREKFDGKEQEATGEEDSCKSKG
jgi:hypothetical protein